MDLPAFDLLCADGSRFTSADLSGRPWYLYVARHPGCFVCQHALARALEHRAEAQALGGDIVVFFNARPEYVTHWVQNSELPDDLRVVIDPDAEFYDALGTIRSPWLQMVTDGVGQLWRARDNIRNWRVSTNDMQRMGADVAVGSDGRIRFKHICTNPEDRADPADVLAALG